MSSHEQRLLERILGDIAVSLGRPARPLEVAAGADEQDLGGVVVELKVRRRASAGLVQLEAPGDLVAGGQVEAGAGWTTAVHVDPSTLSTDQRARLTRHFLGVAVAKCQRITSLNRRAVALLRRAAPAELLLGTQSAALDTVHHARLAFGLAARLGGQQWRPRAQPSTPSDVGDIADGALLRRVLNESCVDGTVAAICCNIAAERAQDPVLSTILDRIASEEEAHAALGWHVVHWLEQSSPRNARSAVDLLHDAYALAPALPSTQDLALESWGLLGTDTVSAARDRAFMLVIFPATAVLR